MTTRQVLTDEQAEHFLEHGFVVVHDCFSMEAAAELTGSVWTRLGYDPDDQSSWTEPTIHMPSHRQLDVKEFAPKAWLAACDLVGGADRVKEPFAWGDGFIVNLYQGADSHGSQRRCSHPDGTRTVTSSAIFSTHRNRDC